jgi:hypothetical protein
VWSKNEKGRKRHTEEVLCARFTRLETKKGENKNARHVAMDESTTETKQKKNICAFFVKASFVFSIFCFRFFKRSRRMKHTDGYERCETCKKKAKSICVTQGNRKKSKKGRKRTGPIFFLCACSMKQ